MDDTPKSPSPAPIRLLLVEDDENDVFLFRELLAESPFPFVIESADCMMAAVKRLETGGIDLILSDLSLPDSHGIHTFTTIQAAAPETPVIVLSGMDDEEMAIEIVERGAQDYLVKGQINCALLVRAIRYALKRVEAEKTIALERRRAEENQALYNRQLREKNQLLEDDMRMASEVQQAFLPQQLSGLLRKAARNSLHFYSSYVPAGALGGDFFHILPLSDTTAGVFISDVMGHGVRAALVTALERALVEELASVATNPGEFLTQINRSLLSILRRTGTPLFVSAFYLFVDVTFSEIRYAIAGHPRQWIVRRSLGKVEPLSTHGHKPGPALGVFADQRYEMFREKLLPGDLVMLFTDGLFEVEDVNGDTMDQDRLLEIVREKMHLPPAELSAAILDAVKQHAADGQFADDVCLVIMDYEGGIARTNGHALTSETSQLLPGT